MKKITILLSSVALCILTFVNNTNAQISKGGMPLSFTTSDILNETDGIALTPINVEAALREDVENEKNGAPHRCGISIPVDINMENSGSWTELRNGKRLWKLKIKSEGAHALGIYYNSFQLPLGAQLFLYNKEKTQVIGAFTWENNTESKLFATEMIQGDEVNIELILPQFLMSEVLLSISEVAYFYRDVNYLFRNINRDFGDSDDCQVNVNCSPEGDTWKDEKRGVARILLKDGSNYGYCTGSLVNNVREDCTPYFLTADHCGQTSLPADFNQWIFYFNFEASGCSNPGSQPSSNTITGCTLKSKGGDGGTTGSDFKLLLLSVSSIPDYFKPYYNGWNANNTANSSGGVGIHHPAGDIKKISTYTVTPATDDWNNSGYYSHWRLTWASTTNGHGISEGGSSGSPLFDSNGRIIGTLTGGSSTCDNPTWPDYFGKMSYHWTSNGTTNDKRLKPWLDPDNTGSLVLNGTNQPCGNNLPTADFFTTQTTVLVGGTVNFQDLSSSAQQWDWTFEGGTPGTSTATNPTITYNTVGKYDVTLKATNSNGNDTETKTDYINVIDQFTECNTLHFPLDFPVSYPWQGGNGYVTGTNKYNFTQVADYFKTSEVTGYNRVEGVYVLPGKITGTTTTVTFKIFADNSGLPGTVLGSETKQLNEITPFKMNYIEFDPPITFTGSFFVGVTLPNGAQSAAGDTLVIISDTANSVIPGSAFCEYQGTWQSYSALASINFRLGIHPYVCPFNPNAPPVANFTGSPRITFVDEPVNFMDLSINDPTTWAWSFQNGTPPTSNSEDPTGIKWSLPGFYDISLTATNTKGNNTKIEQDYIEVREHTCENLTANYTMGFEVTEDLLEWVVQDVNADNISWGYFNGATLQHSGDNMAASFWNNNGVTSSNDWLFTKCLTLEAGLKYRISFYYRARDAAYQQKMKVSIGNDQTAAAMTQQIVNLGAFSNATYTQSVTEFSVTTSGSYYIGFHDYSDADKWGILLDDINIEKYNNKPNADFVSNYKDICVGGSVSFADNSDNNPTSWEWTFSGGTPPSATSANPIVTYNTAGVYTVSLIATNVVGSDTETKTNYITVHAAPSLSTSFTAPLCNGDANGSVTVTASGGSSPYVYLWNDPSSQTNATATGLSAGTYNVSVTDNNYCNAITSVTITQPVELTTTTTSTNETSTGAGDGTATVTPTGGTPNYSYKWDANAGNQITQTATGLNTGTYNVTTTDGNGCTEVDNVFVDINTVIADISNRDYRIYPNPTSGSVIIEMNNTGIRRIEVCDILGKSLVSKVVAEDKVQLDLTVYKQGIYFLMLHTDTTVFSHKIIKTL